MNLKRIWTNKREILKGLLNLTFKRSKIESVFNKRYSICRNCPLLDLSGDECEVPGTEPCCGECGCSLKLKLRSMESECPINKWKSEKI